MILKTFNTSAKSALLSTSLVSLFVLGEEPDVGAMIFPLFLLSYVITFIISTGMIFITIIPFYELTKSKDRKQIFNKYFPIYAVVFFIGLLVIVIKLKFVFFISGICMIAYVTALQSWVWFFKKLKG